MCVHTEQVCINIIIATTGYDVKKYSELPFYTPNNARIYFLRGEKLKT